MKVRVAAGGVLTRHRSGSRIYDEVEGADVALLLFVRADPDALGCNGRAAGAAKVTRRLIGSPTLNAVQRRRVTVD